MRENWTKLKKPLLLIYYIIGLIYFLWEFSRHNWIMSYINFDMLFVYPFVLALFVLSLIVIFVDILKLFPDSKNINYAKCISYLLFILALVLDARCKWLEHLVLYILPIIYQLIIHLLKVNKAHRNFKKLSLYFFKCLVISLVILLPRILEGEWYRAGQ